MKRGHGIAWLSLILLGVGWSDTVVLTNGRKMEGLVTAEEPRRIQFEQHGIKLWLDRSRIRSIARADTAERQELLAGLHAPQPHEPDYYPGGARDIFLQLRTLDDLRSEVDEARANLESIEQRARGQAARFEKLKADSRKLLLQLEETRKTLNTTSRTQVDAYNALHGDYQQMRVGMQQTVIAHEKLVKSGEAWAEKSREISRRYETACRKTGRAWGRFLQSPDVAESRSSDWFARLQAGMDTHPIRKGARNPDEVQLSTTEDGKTRLRIQADRSGHFGVPVILNGTTDVNLLVDTGASMTLISTTTAREAGVTSMGAPITAVLADGKEIQVMPGILDQITIGGQAFLNEPVGISAMTPNNDFDGLLGMTLLRKARLTVSEDTLILDLPLQDP